MSAFTWQAQPTSALAAADRLPDEQAQWKQQPSTEQVVVSAQTLRRLVLARPFPLLPSATVFTVTGLSWLLMKYTIAS